MIIKNHTHSAIVFNYFFAKDKERAKYCSDRNVFYEDHILYSYGRHFPLAVKCRNGYVLNGDTYSSTTSGHQNLTRSIADLHWLVKSHKMLTGKNRGICDLNVLRSIEYKHSDERKRCPICSRMKKGHKPVHHCIIPFSALQGAGIKPEDVFILDVTDDTSETVKRKNPKTGELEDYHIHRLGASLLRVERKRYFSSIDNSARRWGSYYLVKLKSRRINTVEEAYRDLAGNLDDEQYQEYQLGKIKRQGEYFLEPHPELKTREMKKKAKPVKYRVNHVLDVRVKTPRTKRLIRERTASGYWNGIAQRQIRVIRTDGVPYYILMNPEHLSIPENAFVDGRALYAYGYMARQYDLSNGNGNPHVARDAIMLPDGMYSRGTLRHPEHKMIKMGEVWHKIYRNTAVNSWTANGGVD